MIRIRRNQPTSPTLKRSKTGQTAIEYMLLFGIVVSVVLVGFKVHLARIYPAANTFFFNAVNQIYGAPSECGDGNCTFAENATHSCCSDCGVWGNQSCL